MKTTPVHGSSNVRGIGYDPATQTLRVEFHSGTYEYDGVTPAQHEALMAADSKGSFIHAHVRGKQFRKL